MAIAVAGAWVVRTQLVEPIYVASGSMDPTLAVGGHYLVNRLVYKFREPRRGEIISFTNPVDERTPNIKRVIAVGGDRVELRRKKVYLNGEPLEEPYTVHTRASEDLAGDNLGPLTVPAESYFVLGDNRDESFDSSVWKDPASGRPIYFVPLKNVKGRLILIP